MGIKSGEDYSGKARPPGKRRGRRAKGAFGLRRESGPMGLQIQYVPAQGGAVVLSCSGFGSAVRLPEKIDGHPVREIGAYAFSSPGAAAARLPAGVEIRSAAAEGPAVPGGAERFLGGPALREIILPAGIEAIGEYAFYNCTGLARITLPAGAARIGNGAFMNCGALGRADFAAEPGEATCLPGLLAEIPRELRVSFASGGGTASLIFPEYYEESVENGPARIFEHFIRGAGYRYRQCFQGDRLDIEDYDAQFSVGKTEAGPETAARIALERLRHPFRLSEAAEGQYLFFLTEHGAEAAELLVATDDPAGLAFLAGRGVLTEKSMESAVEAAAKAERAECLSILLNERHKRFGPKEKTFDL